MCHFSSLRFLSSELCYIAWILKNNEDPLHYCYVKNKVIILKTKLNADHFAFEKKKLKSKIRLFSRKAWKASLLFFLNYFPPPTCTTIERDTWKLFPKTKSDLEGKVCRIFTTGQILEQSEIITKILVEKFKEKCPDIIGSHKRCGLMMKLSIKHQPQAQSNLSTGLLE